MSDRSRINLELRRLSGPAGVYLSDRQLLEKLEKISAELKKDIAEKDPKGNRNTKEEKRKVKQNGV